MSELIATVNSENLPEKLKQYTQLQFKEDSIGRVAFYGLNGGHTRLAEADVLEAYGYDVNEVQEPAKAIWRTTEHDIPVTIVGSFGRAEHDDEEYLKVTDSKVGIPRSELIFLPKDGEETAGSNGGEVEELRREVASLRAQVEEVIGINARLTAEKEQLEAENERLAERVRELEEERKNPPAAVVSEPAPAEPAVAAPPPAETTPSNKREGRLRARLKNWPQWVPNMPPWAHPPAEREPSYAAVRMPDGRLERVETDEIYYGPENDGRSMAVAAGIGAAALIGGVIGYYLHKTGNNPGNDVINYHLNSLSVRLSDIKNQLSGLKGQHHTLIEQHKAMENTINGDHAIIARDNKLIENLTAQVRGLKESLRQTYNYSFSRFQYPWDWAYQKYGNNAEGMLHILGQKAAKHGHHVRWIYDGYLPNGARKEILEVDGTTNTQKVLQVISQYK